MGVDVLTSGRSDHHSIMLTISEPTYMCTRKGRIFRFDAKWAKKDDGESPIRKVWQQQVVAPNSLATIRQKMALCRKELLSWSAKKKKISQAKLKEKMINLESLQSLAFPNLREIQKLEEKISSYIEKEDHKYRYSQKILV